MIIHLSFKNKIKVDDLTTQIFFCLYYWIFSTKKRKGIYLFIYSVKAISDYVKKEFKLQKEKELYVMKSI